MTENQKEYDLNYLWLDYLSNRSQHTRSKLIETYLPLVKLVAQRMAIGLPQHVDTEDFISEGFLGLLHALERFDPSRGIKFETYAISRIRGSILDALRAKDWVPTSVRQKAKLYEKAVSELEYQLGRAASDSEIAQKLSISLKQLTDWITQLNSTTLVSLDDFASEYIDSGNSTPLQIIEKYDLKNTLAEAIGRLPEKERIVVSLYYYEGLTLKEISFILKLSEARISQLHTKAIFRLRGSLSRIKTSLI